MRPRNPRDPRMKPNPGYCPAEAEGKRVFVELANGSCPSDPWPADGKPPRTRWSIQKRPHDIAFYRLA